LGLVELYHYDSEEFWSRDGHLLLRGNNGTGKSKVLSLTLPFLLDAQIKPTRIEPDADSNKRMSWNLLMGQFSRRMGYAWLEFGPLADDGQPRYLTLGAGLLAVEGRPQVDAWYYRGRRRRPAPQPGLVVDERAEGGADKGAPPRDPPRWRFGAADYAAAAAIAAVQALSGAPFTASWDGALVPAMQQYGLAITEEAVAALLLQDLER
jgi:hypothetical protein